MKRLVWFAAGAAAGVTGAAYAKRKAREAAVRYRPVNVAKGAVDRLADAVRDGRAAMAAKEAELRRRQEPAAEEPVQVLVVDAGLLEPAHLDAIGHHFSGPRRRSRR